MSSTLRLFFGIRIPATPGIEAVCESLSQLSGSFRPTSEVQLHLTLLFLGEVPTSHLPGLIAMLPDVTERVGEHLVELRGLGAFPKVKDPSVVWVGVTPEEPVKRLSAALKQHVEALGLITETRPYHPHVTLARVKGGVPQSFGDWMAERADLSLGQVRFSQLELMASDAGPHGTTYRTVAASRLCGPGA